MKVFFAALVAFLLAFLGMAVGRLLSGRCLLGTCGGSSNLADKHGKTRCDFCRNIPEDVSSATDSDSSSDPPEPSTP